MSRTIYCNGTFVPEARATISIFDRGTLFGDAVYEVTAVFDGRMIDNDLHLARLQRSLGELGIPMPAAREEIARIQHELIARNGLREGVVYLQVSRGIADRNFLWPEDIAPTLIGFTQAKTLHDTAAQREGIEVDLAPDTRWQRRDIKTVMLLGQVLAKAAARRKGCDDVWLCEDGMVTEGASATAYIVTAAGQVVTRPNSRISLPGCTRQALLRLCAVHGLTLDERPFSPAEAQAAAEAFQTSASSFVTPVIRIAGVAVGTGAPGPVTRHLQQLYLETVGVRAPVSN